MFDALANSAPDCALRQWFFPPNRPLLHYSTELICMTVKYLCDRNLRSHTRVSRYLATATCPVYFHWKRSCPIFPIPSSSTVIHPIPFISSVDPSVSPRCSCCIAYLTFWIDCVSIAISPYIALRTVLFHILFVFCIIRYSSPTILCITTKSCFLSLSLF